MKISPPRFGEGAPENTVKQVFLEDSPPQIRGVKISPPRFGEGAPENTVKQVFLEDSPPKFGG